MSILDFIFKLFGYHRINQSVNKSRINELESQLKESHDKYDRFVKESDDRHERFIHESESTIDEKANFRLAKWQKENEKSIREDAIKRSKSVTNGQITENFVPFHPDFNYNPKDARFLGSPIDLVIYDGLTNDDEVKNIIFMEVKTNKSRLTKRQKSIKKCIESNKITFEEFRISD